MDTTINTTRPTTAASNSKTAPAKSQPVETKTVAPEKTDTDQAVQSSSRAGKPVFQRMVPKSPLTTYRDQDSGRLIVRVYDRKNGDILIEFPPEKAFRSMEEVLRGVGKNPKKATKI